MLHPRRRWNVTDGLTNDEIVDRLVSLSLCLCSAFRTAAGTIWACDSTSEDALQEYAVLRPGGDPSRWNQVDSVTVSWCRPERLRELLGDADLGRMDHSTSTDSIGSHQLEEEHAPCVHCR